MGGVGLGGPHRVFLLSFVFDSCVLFVLLPGEDVGTVPDIHDGIGGIGGTGGTDDPKKAIQYHTLQGAQGVYRRLVTFLLQSVHLVSEVFNQRSAERQVPATEKKLATMVQQGLVRAQAAFHITTGTCETPQNVQVHTTPLLIPLD